MKSKNKSIVTIFALFLHLGLFLWVWQQLNTRPEVKRLPAKQAAERSIEAQKP